MAAPGLYLHVPFCSAICPYCDFSVLKAGVPARRRFVEHLVAEVALAAPEWRDPRPFDTLYFGGGTPSLLPAEELARVVAACREHVTVAPRGLGLPRGQPRGRDAGRLRRLAAARGAHSLPRRAVLLRRGAPLPRPPSRRASRRGPRSRPRSAARLPHRLGRPHLRPARPVAGGLAARAGDGRGARAGPRLVLSAHHPRADALRRRREARPAVRDARGRAGRALRDHPPRPRRRGLLRVRGLQLRARPRPRVAPQPQVLGPHALPRARPLGAFVRGRGLERAAGGPPLVERAAHAALGGPRGGGRATASRPRRPSARRHWRPRR